MNAGPQFTFTPSVSFYVACESAEEIEALWNGRPPSSARANLHSYVSSLRRMLPNGPEKVPGGYRLDALAHTLLDDLATDPASVLTNLLSGVLNAGVRAVTPDLNRRLLTRKQVVEQHFALGGRPFGHGFTATNRARGTAYYSFDQGQFRFVVLDTVNPNGYYDGSLDQTQFAWLQSLLGQSSDKVVMVFSHHTSDSMGNPLVATGADLELRVTGGTVLDELHSHHQVVAWFNGHTHTNKITPRLRADGGGLWEITTASHIDWPQQARIVEVADNTDGTLSIFTTMVDHAGPASSGAGTGSPTQLAGLARELAATAWHDHAGGGGAAQDRNVELLVANPLS
mgnify:CR=1 FL=1